MTEFQTVLRVQEPTLRKTYGFSLKKVDTARESEIKSPKKRPKKDFHVLSEALFPVFSLDFQKGL